MKKFLYIFAGLSIILGCKSKTANVSISVDKDMLLYNLKALSHDSLGGRFFGTTGNYKSQKFIADQFESLGIKPAFSSGSIQEYPFTFKGSFRQRIYPIPSPSEDFRNVPDTTVTGGNVVTMITGESEKAIVITGHLDHLGIRDGEIFNGADDNASGAAALITIADYFMKKSPKHTLYFAAVDAEEIGSLGCDYLLNNFPTSIDNIVLNINMDMIAHNDSLELFASGLYHYPNLKQPLHELKSTDIQLLYGHDDPNEEGVDDWTYQSDHREFHKRQIPYIYFGVADHEDYHRSTDTYDRINESFYVEAVKLVIEAIEGYDAFLPTD